MKDPYPGCRWTERLGEMGFGSPPQTQGNPKSGGDPNWLPCRRRGSIFGFAGAPRETGWKDFMGAGGHWDETISMDYLKIGGFGHAPGITLIKRKIHLIFALSFCNETRYHFIFKQNRGNKFMVATDINGLSIKASVLGFQPLCLLSALFRYEAM